MRDREAMTALALMIPMVVAATPPASDFEDGPDGWDVKAIDNGSMISCAPVPQVMSGGNPGAFLFGATPEGTAFAMAPPEFLGDLRPFIGGWVVFDIVVLQVQEDCVITSFADVELFGDRGFIRRSFDPATCCLPEATDCCGPDFPVGHWRRLAIPLIDEEWVESDGVTFEEVLANVTEFRITIDPYGASSDAGGLDNVRLIAPATCPTPSVADLLFETASNGQNGGASMDFDGSRVIAGAPTANGGEGRATLFLRDGDVWIEEQVLSVSGSRPGDQYGKTVAIQGDTAIVGSRLAGTVVVFDRRDGTWVQGQVLNTGDDGFGAAIAFDGALLAVGTDVGSGLAYIFSLDEAGNFVSPVQLAPFGIPNDIALDGSTVALASTNSGAGSPGTVTVFEFNGQEWLHAATITAPPSSSQFATSVALRDGLLVVGSPGSVTPKGADEGTDGLSDAGQVFVYIKDRGSWPPEPTATIRPPVPRFAGRFGQSVAAGDGVIAVGEQGNADCDIDGRVYVFRDLGGAWVLRTFVDGLDGPGDGDLFGVVVDLHQAEVAASGPGLDIGGLSNVGHVRVFPVPEESACDACLADINQDGVVDSEDLNLVLGQFGGPGVADLDSDGLVDSDDLNVVLASFGLVDCH